RAPVRSNPSTTATQHRIGKLLGGIEGVSFLGGKHYRFPNNGRLSSDWLNCASDRKTSLATVDLGDRTVNGRRARTVRRLSLNSPGLSSDKRRTYGTDRLGGARAWATITVSQAG